MLRNRQSSESDVCRGLYVTSLSYTISATYTRADGELTPCDACTHCGAKTEASIQPLLVSSRGS